MGTIPIAGGSCLGGHWVATLFSVAIVLPLLSFSPLRAEEEADGVRPERGERAAAQGDRTERRAEMRKKMLEKFDADGDGKLNDEERTKMRKEMGNRRGRGPRRGGEKGNREGKRGRPGKDASGRSPEGRRDQSGPPDLDKLFERFDRDGDDRLDREEFKGALRVLREMHQRRMGRPGEGRRGGPDSGKDRERFRHRPRPDREGHKQGRPPKRGPRPDRD